MKEAKDIALSSNVNEVIKAVLNPLFLQKDCTRNKKYQKTPKAPKAQRCCQKKQKKANKRISDFFPFRFFLCACFVFVRL